MLELNSSSVVLVQSEVSLDWVVGVGGWGWVGGWVVVQTERSRWVLEIFRS